MGGDSRHVTTCDSLNNPMDNRCPVHQAYRAFRLRADRDEVHGGKVTLYRNLLLRPRPRSIQVRYVQYVADGDVMGVS